MIRPPRLRAGDTIGIVSPSWGAAGAFPHRVHRGVAQLAALGFHVKLGRHALHQRGFVADTPEHRVADLQEMFQDPDVRAIIATIGGDHACHVLPLLDFACLRDSPTIFMGYSDITVLNIAIWQQTGVVTFNGPMLLPDFAEYPRLFAYTEQSFLRTACEARPVGRLAPGDWWTEEVLHWAEHKDLERPRRRAPSPGWTWLRPGQAEGILIGGCLESLQHLRGTAVWPDWAEAILFLETSEGKPSPATVDGILMDYDNMGGLAAITGTPVWAANALHGGRKASATGGAAGPDPSVSLPDCDGHGFRPHCTAMRAADWLSRPD